MPLADTPVVQLVTQVLMALIGAIIVGSIVIFIGLTLLKRRHAPPKSLFVDLLPVTRDRAFTRD